MFGRGRLLLIHWLLVRACMSGSSIGLDDRGVRKTSWLPRLGATMLIRPAVCWTTFSQGRPRLVAGSHRRSFGAAWMQATTTSRAGPGTASPVTEGQLKIAERRKQTCSQCSQCSRLSAEGVACAASRRTGLSYLYDRCPLRKWVGPSDEMPVRPQPIPSPPAWLQRHPVRHEHHITAANGGNAPVRELFVYGFPGLYAGANTELHHQILLWRSIGISVHLIPSGTGYRSEPLYQPMVDLGVTVHQPDDFAAIVPGAPVLGFCNDQFLVKLDQILQFSHNTVFVNCMTWLFELEKQRFREGKLAALLYQNEAVRRQNATVLRTLNPDPRIQLLTFRPYFADDLFPWIEHREQKQFTIGRISRNDADKYSANTLEIWNSISSPLPKRGIMLGFGKVAQHKIGPRDRWIETFADQSELSQQDFYRRCDVIIQPADTTENWPRIGLEAMASGTVLLVDNRGGWQQMIEHGVSGWLCNHAEDFVRYGDLMANDPAKRREVAQAARVRLQEIAGRFSCSRSWRSVLERLGMVC